MEYLGLGLDLQGKPLFKNANKKDFTEGVKRMLQPSETFTALLERADNTRGKSFSEIERKKIDPADPFSVGWSYLVHKHDPNLEEIKRIMFPLAVHRGMANPNEPLLFEGDTWNEWNNWIEFEYEGLELMGKIQPQYILLVGSPQAIPFEFQTVLDIAANVGRVHFDDLKDLETYVDKLIRLETQSAPVVDKEVLFFGPNAGQGDATFYSHEFMVKPLRDHTRDSIGFDVHTLLDFKATKDNLMNALTTRKPALVYTASHGLGARDAPFKEQKRVNGGIICQYGSRLTMDDIFTADDVPMDQPFLEGSIFYQFACFGYGTPKMSHYSHWLRGQNERLAKEDFISALPKKLLAHPQGPVAYIGHLDTAFLHAFAEPNNANLIDKWDGRISPFVHSIERLLGIYPSGMSMERMNRRFSFYNAKLADLNDRAQQGITTWNDRNEDVLCDMWITRNDAKNYMIFGDPAVHLRIPSGNGIIT